MADLTLDQKFELILSNIGKTENNLSQKIDERFELLKQWQELQGKIIENQENKIENQNKILENQTRLIELLSSRSVKQEKEVQNLKWKQLETQTDIGSTVEALSAKFIELEAEVKSLKANKDKEAS